MAAEGFTVVKLLRRSGEILDGEVHIRVGRIVGTKKTTAECDSTIKPSHGGTPTR
jgi:hypothetical protein